MELKEEVKQKMESGSGALTVNKGLETYYNSICGIDYVSDEKDEEGLECDDECDDECAEECADVDYDGKCGCVTYKGTKSFGEDEEKVYFELTNDTITVKGHVLHRIKSLKTFGVGNKTIKKGDLGGFVESLGNLQGGSWVFNDAIVLGDARVTNGSVVGDNAVVAGNTDVINSKIYGYSIVTERAYCKNSSIYDNARISGNCKVFNSKIRKNIDIFDKTFVRNAYLNGTIIVSDNADIDGAQDNTFQLEGNYKIGKDAVVKNNIEVCSFCNFGSRNDILTAYTTKYGGVRINTGCFHGDLDEFIKQVNEKPDGRIKDEYLAIAQVIKVRFIDHYKNNK